MQDKNIDFNKEIKEVYEQYSKLLFHMRHILILIGKI